MKIGIWAIISYITVFVLVIAVAFPFYPAAVLVNGQTATSTGQGYLALGGIFISFVLASFIVGPILGVLMKLTAFAFPFGTIKFSGSPVSSDGNGQ